MKWVMGYTIPDLWSYTVRVVQDSISKFLIIYFVIWGDSQTFFKKPQKFPTSPLSKGTPPSLGVPLPLMTLGGECQLES